jgi:predicted PurR-regulated permease PerM
VGDPTPSSTDELRVDLAWQSVLVGLLAISVLGLLWALVGVASVAVTLIVVALFVAMALDPVVSALERRFHLGRGLATALVMAASTVLFGVFVAIAGPQLVQESATLERQLPKTVDQLGELPLIGKAIRDADLSDKLTTMLASLPDHTQGQGAQIGGVLKTVSFGLGAAVMGFFLVTGALYEGPRLIRNVRSAIPAGRQEAADGIGRIVYAVLAKYFAGSLLVAVLNGIWTAAAAIIAGVPLSPVLAVWSALTSLIPQIGGLLGFGLVFIVSLTAGVGPAIFMTIAFLAFMLFTNHVLVPLVVGKAVSLSPPVTMLAAVGGFSVAGIVGALFAVPTFGAIKAVAMHLRGTDPEADHDEHVRRHPGVLTRLRARFGHHAAG